MKIVIDTNIIFKDFHLSGTKFRLLFENSRRTGDTIHFPQIVIDETKNKYRDQLITTQSKIEKELSAIKRLTSAAFKSPVSPEFINAEAKKYSEYLEKAISTNGIKVVPYPDTPHKKLVTAALARKKPFTEGGKGYRDALIWENVKSLVARESRITTDPDVIIISDNTKDFGEDSQLHNDFIDDLESSGLNRNSIAIVSDIDQFTDKYLKPQLQLLNSLKFKLKSGSINDVNLDKQTKQMVVEFLTIYQFEPEDLGLRREYEEIKIQDVPEDDIDYVINEVRRVSENELLIEIIASCVCTAEFFIYKSDYYGLPDDVSPNVYERNWNEHYMAASEELNLNFKIMLTVDSSFTQITSEEIERIDT